MINHKQQLESFVMQHWNEINKYIDDMSEGLPLPFYTSVDIRESNSKFAPVDNNLYPAGFNNICQLDLNICVDRMKNYILKFHPHAQKIALIPESHTKNKYYLDHLYTLQNCLQQGGFETDLISLDPNFFTQAQAEGLMQTDGSVMVTSFSEHQLRIFPALLDHAKNCITDRFQNKFDVLILNHDQSLPLPINWQLLQQPVYPTPLLGWTVRQKNEHFKYYKTLCDQFCEHFSIDSKLISADFRSIHQVDFNSKEGLDRISQAVQEIQTDLHNPQAPIFIKADQGTYGMGISVVRSPQEVLEMNRKTRNKMDVGKNNLKFSSVLVQEGVETMVTVDGHPAEVTIYLIGGKSTGGFMRVNPLKDVAGNLNAKGMVYQKYCISEIYQGQDHQCKEAIYCLIARLSTLATALEIKNIKNK